MARTKIIEVAILRYPQALQSAVYGLTDLFMVANLMAGKHAELKGMQVRVSHWEWRGGAMVCVQDSMPELPAQPMLTLIIPPCMGAPMEKAQAKPFAQWVNAQYAQGVAVGSVCGGAFLLAETGLLNGRAATTHWSYAQQFAQRFPEVTMAEDKLLIDEGDLITSGGMMAWTDLGLRLVERLMGRTVMLETARFMIVDPPGREQREYSSFVPPMQHGDAAVLKVQHWLHAQGGREVSVASMAKKAGLEERTFLRRFRKATGLRPTEYCQHLRVEKGKEMLELGHESIAQVAYAVGYEDVGAFRHIFQRNTGLTPGEFRRRFAVAA